MPDILTCEFDVIGSPEKVRLHYHRNATGIYHVHIVRVGINLDGTETDEGSGVRIRTCDLPKLIKALNNIREFGKDELKNERLIFQGR